MKKKIIILAFQVIAVFLLFGGNTIAQDLQSEIVDMKNGMPYSGVAQFKFAIVSDTISIWSNDGTSIDASEPLASCSIPVSEGKYSFEIGKKPMKPFFYELLNLYNASSLITWVNTGEGFKLFKKEPVTITQITDKSKPSAPKANSTEDLENKDFPVTNEQLLTKSKGKINPAVEDEEGENAENLDGLLKEQRMKRLDMFGKISPGALLNAKKQMRNMPAIPSEDAGLWNWEWLGPGNIGGRIRAIAIHPYIPSIIFIGSVGGGIWKTNNGGATWAPVNDFLANLDVTSIVYDPNQLDIMYASTGEGFGGGIPGAGIFKSTDGGTTWNQLPSTNNDSFIWVNRLAHHPDSSNVLYAVTSISNYIDGGLYKSTDGGTTWINKSSSNSNYLQVCVKTSDPSQVMVGTSHGLLISTDYGETFNYQNYGGVGNLPDSCGRCEASYCPSNSSRIYASLDINGGEIWRSEDKGTTWTQRWTGFAYLAEQGWYNNTIWVDPANSDRILFGGTDIWKSIDGGLTIQQISDWRNYHNGGVANSAHADQHIIVKDPAYNGSGNNTVYFGNDGGIQKASNVWTTSTISGWTNLCNSTLGITQFYGGAAAADGSVIVGGAQDNDSPRFRKSGPWSGAGNWFQAETGDGGSCAIDPTNADIIYTEYTKLKIEKSADGGVNNYYRINGLDDAGHDSSALFIAPFSMNPNNQNTLIAGGAKIWRTTDGAANWSSIFTGTGISFVTDKGKIIQMRCSAIDIAPGNSNIIWVAYQNGNIYKTTNGTSGSPTWSAVGLGIPHRWVTDIAINPFNSDEVFVTIGGYLPDDVWFTADGGNTWTQRTGTAPNNLPALQVNTVRFHPTHANWVYIGTDLGVFSSEDKGNTWSVNARYETNEGPCNVDVEELFWQGDEYLIAATHGRGMYRAHPLSDIYVDKNAAPGGNGSFAWPYQTVTEAENNAGWGNSIFIKSNTYDEVNGLRLYKKGSIHTTNGTSVIK